MWLEQSRNSGSRRKPDLKSIHGLGRCSVGEMPVLQAWGPAFRSPPTPRPAWVTAQPACRAEQSRAEDCCCPPTRGTPNLLLRLCLWRHAPSQNTPSTEQSISDLQRTRHTWIFTSAQMRQQSHSLEVNQKKKKKKKSKNLL